MSEGYGTTGARRGRSAGGTGTTSDHAGTPFRGHTIRVSEFRRDVPRARRTPLPSHPRGRREYECPVYPVYPDHNERYEDHKDYEDHEDHEDYEDRDMAPDGWTRHA
ncbi:hypothetical protein ACVW19_004320 [Streptomyces sp. TE5632]